MLEQRDWNFTPALKHPRDQVGSPEVDSLAEFQRRHERALRGSQRRRHRVGVRQSDECLFGACVANINAEERQKFVEAQPIDQAQALKSVDIEFELSCFESAQPCA